MGGRRPGVGVAAEAVNMAELARKHPHWHIWLGVNTWFYARRQLSSPPVIRTALSLHGLDEQMTAWEATHPGVNYGDSD